MISASRCTEVSEIDGTKTVRFVAEPSESQLNSGEFAQELLELVDSDGMIVLDFTGVTHVLSPMISAVLLLHRSVTSSHGQLRLAGMNQDVYGVFELLRLERVLDISSP